MQQTIRLRDDEEERALLGRQDSNLRLLRRHLDLRLHARRRVLTLEGEEQPVERGVRVIESLIRRVRNRGYLTEEEVLGALERDSGRSLPGGAGEPGTAQESRIVRALDGTAIRPKTEGQARYVEAMQGHDIVFAIGPAGTGKTYLAVAMAIHSMKRGRYRKLVLVRPAVEAGEKLGFLPGDLTAKVSPYLRPLYDAIGDLVPFAEVKRYMERDIVEVVPLAFMRGRTLDNAFIILDEGQNTTAAQMKMFLTRMGRSSKIVVTGDVTQIDLPRGDRSGLRDAWDRLNGVPGIAFCELGRGDIVRHALVQRIVEAYEGDDA